LREAAVRKVGSEALPKAKPLNADNLFQAEYDATRVRVQGVLLSLSSDHQTLEMQAGLRRFLARLTGDGNGLAPPASGQGQARKYIGIPLGSRIELIGIYAGHGGNRTTGAQTDSFELLLNSPSDLRMLARPSFWTLTRLMAVVGALLGVLVVAIVWIRLLHHRVQERTVQLQKEISEREQADHQRTLAQERTGI